MSSADHQTTPHIASSRQLTAIWVALLCLTAVTVAVARIDLGLFSVLAALAIASCKAFLVIAFFMHLRYEGRRLKALLFLALVVLAIFIGMTFIDLAYRVPA